MHMQTLRIPDVVLCFDFRFLPGSFHFFVRETLSVPSHIPVMDSRDFLQSTLRCGTRDGSSAHYSSRKFTFSHIGPIWIWAEQASDLMKTSLRRRGYSIAATVQSGSFHDFEALNSNAKREKESKLFQRGQAPHTVQ